MTQGKPAGKYGPASGPSDAPPDDTGEALDLPPGGLTLTFGFGPTLFTAADGTDRFGIARKRPDALVDLPHFPGDALLDSLTGGDLCVQACSEDPQVAVHAIRNLSRIAFGRAAIRWSQLGFGRTSSTSRSQTTPRNLFGFKDGTANIKAEDSSVVEDQVWADRGDGAAWMHGGSYLVARKIRMVIETWDRQQLGEQERIVGRDKGEGAPLSGGTEFSDPNFLALSPAGGTKIDPDSHVRLAHPTMNDGAQLLRRGYNFVDGNDDLGRLNAGLFFIAFQRDPRKQFIPIQNRLAKNDLMNEYLKHVGSAVFAVPPAPARAPTSAPPLHLTTFVPNGANSAAIRAIRHESARGLRGRGGRRRVHGRARHRVVGHPAVAPGVADDDEDAEFAVGERPGAAAVRPLGAEAAVEARVRELLRDVLIRLRVGHLDRDVPHLAVAAADAGAEDHGARGERHGLREVGRHLVPAHIHVAAGDVLHDGLEAAARERRRDPHEEESRDREREQAGSSHVSIMRAAEPWVTPTRPGA